MSELSLSDATQVERVASDNNGEQNLFRCNIPAGWAQGRGAFGGLVLGAMLRAIDTHQNTPERMPRSVSGNIAGPALVGPAEIEVQPIRIGNGVSVINATLSQDGQPLATISATLGSARIQDRNWRPEPPQMTPAADSIKPIPLKPPMAPEFTQHFTFKPTRYPPFVGADESRAEGWLEAKLPLDELGPSEVIALLDGWWPATFAREKMPRPAGTVGTTTQFFPIDQEALRGPFYHKAHAPAAQDGFIVEFRELWSADGQLLGLNQQTFVWIK